MNPTLLLATIAAACAAAHPAAQPAPQSQTQQAEAAPAPEPIGVDKMAATVEALRPLVTTKLANEFLDGVPDLPRPAPRTVYLAKDRTWHTAAAAEAMPEAERSQLRRMDVNETTYYFTSYGSPLAYARALDLAAAAAPDALGSFEGLRVLDYGYGTVGHLRLMAQAGAHATGVDVDPMLLTIYSEPGDQGDVPGGGSVRLLEGRWPAEEEAARAVGERGPYDLIISKNTLKQGYIHPSQPADPRTLVDLGVPDERFIKSLHEALKPGGVVVIYNLSPAPSKPGERYKPWAEGATPFPREQWEAAGFEVVAFDVNDDGPARALARAIGWDKAGMDVENDLFGHYTIVRRPR